MTLVILGAILAVILLAPKAVAVTFAPKPVPLKPGPASTFKERFLAVAGTADLKGVDPGIALAISALETGNGTGRIFQKTNNLFSLKAGTKWRGPTSPASDGGHFRMYASWRESMMDWALWFSQSKIFKDAYLAAVARRPADCFLELQRGGYAGTDQNYFGKLNRTHAAIV